MKRKMSLMFKIKIFIWWIKNRKNKGGLIENCYFCQSIDIVAHDSWTNDNCYGAEYECLNCGAKAMVHEQWKKAK